MHEDTCTCSYNVILYMLVHCTYTYIHYTRGNKINDGPATPFNFQSCKQNNNYNTGSGLGQVGTIILILRLWTVSLVPRPSPCFSMLCAENSEKAWCILLRNDDVEDAVLHSMATTARV